MNGWTVTGPYHYTGDLHPSFRIDAPDRLVASVYIIDGDEERAFEEAEAIVAALSNKETLQTPA